MIPVGPRSHAGASCRIAVPVALPMHLRAGVREVVGVKSTNTGAGEASALLASVCDEADKHGTALLLHVDPDGDAMTVEQMAAWYNRAGFVLFQAEPPLMMRLAGGAATFNAMLSGAKQ